MFGDEFLEHFSTTHVVSGGKFGSANPSLSEKKTPVIWLILGNMPGDTGYSHGFDTISINGWIGLPILISSGASIKNPHHIH